MVLYAEYYGRVSWGWYYTPPTQQGIRVFDTIRVIPDVIIV
jgi:hypothetical protein